MPKSSEPDFRRAQNRGFRAIAGYIFGGNSGEGAENKVAMTSPVIASSGASASIAMTSPVVAGDDSESDAHLIAFVMPSKYKSLASLPTPLNREVTLREVPQHMELVCGRSGGYYSAEERRVAEARLCKIAQSENLAVTSASKCYSYDPPWTMWLMMRSEVAIEVMVPTSYAAPPLN